MILDKYRIFPLYQFICINSEDYGSVDQFICDPVYLFRTNSSKVG